MKRGFAIIGLLFAATAFAGHPGNGYLGIGVAALGQPGARGIQVRRVDENSPAARAGFKEGDIVVAYNEQPFDTVEQFIRLVRDTPAGRTVHLQILRAGAAQTLSVAIGTRKTESLFEQPDFPDTPAPPMPAMPQFLHEGGPIGIDAQPVSGQLAEYFGVKAGVLVVSVLRDSPGQKAGLKAGDIITRANGDPVSAPRDITAHLRSSKTLSLNAVRNRHEVSFEVVF